MSNTNIITRKNKKGKTVNYKEVDSEKMNEFLNEGYGIEIDLSGNQASLEEDATIKLATPEVVRADDDGRYEEDEER